MTTVRVEIQDADGTPLFSQESETADWISQRRLSGGVIWLAESKGRPGVVLVRRSADAPSNPGRWSYFSGAADAIDDVLSPLRLAREGSEELATRSAEGAVSIPVLACALAARTEILDHVAKRFPLEPSPKLEIRPTLDFLHPHRLFVATEAWTMEASTFASSWPQSGAHKLELGWFGLLGTIDDVRLQDAELDGDVALNRCLRFVAMDDALQFSQEEPTTPHARLALLHLLSVRPIVSSLPRWTNLTRAMKAQ